MPTIRNASGNPIAITDSASAPLQGLRVLGKTTQKTLTGKNLLNFNTEGRTYFGVTFTANADGSVTCVGTSSADNAFANLNYVDMNTLSIPPGTYIVSGAKDGVAVVLVVDGQAVLWQVSGERTVTIPETAVNSWMRVVVDAAGTTVNTTIYPMIRRVEIVDSTWEPYTGGIPSPNPDYPQPLTSVGDDGAVDVKVAGANLITFPYVSANKTEHGLTYTINKDGSVGIKGTATQAGQFVFVNTGTSFADLGITDVATLSCVTRGTLGFVFDDGTSINVDPSTPSVTIAPNGKTFRIRWLSRAGVTYDETIYPMLNVGNTALPWEPYKPAQTLTITTPNGLPGISVPSGGNYTDEDGQQWVCDEIDLERGVYVQRVKKTRLTSTGQTWGQSGNLSTRYTWGYREGIKGAVPMCSHYPCRATGVTSETNVLVNNGGSQIYVNTTFATLAEWKAWLDANDVWLTYALATPVETDLTVDEVLAYKALKTNHPNTTIMSDEDAWLYAVYIQQQAGFTTYWTDPKTDWKNGDHFNLDPDYERIKNNITHVQEITNKINARVEIDAMGDYAITEYPLAAFLNTIATNIEKLSKSMFLVTPTAEMPMHVGNGPGWTAEELNDIEGNLLNMYEELNRQYALVPRLDIMMGIGGINFGS